MAFPPPARSLPRDMSAAPAKLAIRAVMSVIERYWQVAAAQTQAWKTSW